MICDPQCVRDDGEAWIHGAGRDEAARIDDIEIVQFMGLAVRVKDTRRGIVAHATGAILVANVDDGVVGVLAEGCGRALFCSGLHYELAGTCVLPFNPARFADRREEEMIW